MKRLFYSQNFWTLSDYNALIKNIFGRLILKINLFCIIFTPNQAYAYIIINLL